MLSFLYRLLLLGLLFSLVGCSSLGKYNFVKKRETTYLHGQAAAPLQIPAGLSSANVGDDYMLPVVPAAENLPIKQVGLLPPDSLADQIASGKVSKNVLKQSEEIHTGIVRSADLTDVELSPDTHNNVVLPLNEGSLESWGKIAYALNRMGYRLLVQNKNLKEMYILDVPATKYRATKNTQIYVLHMHDNSDGTSYVDVTDEAGKPINLQIATRILKDLQDGLNGKTAASPSREWAHVKQWASELF